MEGNGINVNCCSLIDDNADENDEGSVFNDPRHNSGGEYCFPEERVTRIMTHQRHGRFKFVALDNDQKSKSIESKDPKKPG